MTEDCCGDMPAIDHGMWLSNYTGCAGEAVPVCDEGYTLPDCNSPEVITCNCTGNWSAETISSQLCVGENFV